MTITKQILTQSIKKEAIRLGFADCGFSKVRSLEDLKEIYNKWIDSGFHASMDYMERNVDKRLNPTLLLENAHSVISLLFNYYTNEKLNGEYKISRYAYGTDYHDVIKEKLKILETFIKSLIEDVNQRSFVDSAPVMERYWAQQSGMGWVGKNTCLISRKHGSFIFISEIITSAELDYDEPLKDYCGDCHLCIDACPTEAITNDRFIDSNKCISYQTIENKGDIDVNLKGKFNNYIFGCDICQEVCPWNKKAHAHSEPLFYLRDGIKKLTKDKWEKLDAKDFQMIFKKSAIKRAKFNGLKRNIAFVESKQH